jgi:hypothetical protein
MSSKKMKNEENRQIFSITKMTEICHSTHLAKIPEIYGISKPRMVTEIYTL